MIDPTADERQKARDALGNVNIQDASQLAELIGHLYLKMSEHSSTATAHINTHADDIRTLSNKLNKVATDTDAQFQDLNRLANAAVNPPANPAPAAPVQGMNPACNSRNKNFTFRPYTHEKKDEQWISWIRMFEDAAEMAELSGHQRKLALSYSMRGRAARAGGWVLFAERFRTLAVHLVDLAAHECLVGCDRTCEWRVDALVAHRFTDCLLYTSPSPRD